MFSSVPLREAAKKISGRVIKALSIEFNGRRNFSSSFFSQKQIYNFINGRPPPTAIEQTTFFAAPFIKVIIPPFYTVLERLVHKRSMI